jgi:triosephosphate isomerase
MSIQDVSDGPLVLVNFKSYLEATGSRAVDLARRIAEAGHSSGIRVGVAPQFCDISHVVGIGDLLVFGQHIDMIEPGAFTGKVLAESLKAVGASGTLLNHSERMIRLDEVQRTVIHARDLGLLTVVCAGNADLAAAVSLMNPDMVAIEPPELIGSGRAVSKEKPEVIESSVRKIRAVNKSIRILCGAGISTGEDVHAALKLGAQGVLVASGVVKSPKPEHVISDFCEAARRFREST